MPLFCSIMPLSRPLVHRIDDLSNVSRSGIALCCKFFPLYGHDTLTAILKPCVE